MRVQDEREQLKKRFLEAASDLRNAYWFIRYSRFHKDRRRHYRRAQKEKARLAGLGFHPEAIRLYRLHLMRPDCETRYARFLAVLEAPEQLTLFLCP